jgi:hypothetical protein
MRIIRTSLSFTELHFFLGSPSSVMLSKADHTWRVGVVITGDGPEQSLPRRIDAGDRNRRFVQLAASSITRYIVSGCQLGPRFY